MSAVRSLLSHRSASRFLLLLVGVVFLIGIVLLSCFGPVKLSCSRVYANQVQCSLTQFVAFGSIKVQETTLDPLKLAKVDERVKQTVEVTGSPSGIPFQKQESVYGVLLVGRESIIFNGYSYDREHQQQIVDRINKFVNDSTASSLVVRAENHWVNVAALLLFGLSIAVPFMINSNRSTNRRTKKSLN